ncbi:DUF2218 domain-containing protein [Amaricoccus macauensis]|uniref:DUF2218 domain-containing protein n=1 Tax=Amaricoccus macauensis TaxID=57001 RepID=UPI003C7CB6D7
MTQFSDTGTFSTPQASKYLQQLCKHFGHKVDVTFDETSGNVAFPMGPATLEATNGTLQITVTGTAPEDIEKGREVIDSHLARFAFREEFEAMNWQGEKVA